jgi:homeobox protein cut-like
MFESAYQTEIDALTKRSKTSESAFLNIYKLLAEAPDPYPLLEAAVDQTVRASEAKLLESELSRANEQIKSLKSQLKEAEKVEKEFQKQTEKLEKLESKLEEMVKVQVSNKEAELDAVYGERIMNFQQREKDLTKQLDLTKKQLTDLRTSNESNQAKILDDSSRRDFETVSRRAEIELVEVDLERSHRRIEEVERRNEKLRAEIEAVRSGSEAQER